MQENYKDHKRWNMKGGGGLLGRYETQKFGCGAMVKCLLFGIVMLSVLNPAVLPNSVFQSEHCIIFFVSYFQSLYKALDKEAMVRKFIYTPVTCGSYVPVTSIY